MLVCVHELCVCMRAWTDGHALLLEWHSWWCADETNSGVPSFNKRPSPFIITQPRSAHYRAGCYLAPRLALDALLLRALPAALFAAVMYPLVGLQVRG